MIIPPLDFLLHVDVLMVKIISTVLKNHDTIKFCSIFKKKKKENCREPEIVQRVGCLSHSQPGFLSLAPSVVS